MKIHAIATSIILHCAMGLAKRCLEAAGTTCNRKIFNYLHAIYTGAKVIKVKYKKFWKEVVKHPYPMNSHFVPCIIYSNMVYDYTC
jgi:hypothetical protein